MEVCDTVAALTLPQAHIIASGFRTPLTVRLPVTLAFPLHWSDVTVAAAQERAPIVYAAVVLNASVKCDAEDVNTRGAVHTRPRITVFVASQIA